MTREIHVLGKRVLVKRCKKEKPAKVIMTLEPDETLSEGIIISIGQMETSEPFGPLVLGDKVIFAGRPLHVEYKDGEEYMIFNLDNIVAKVNDVV